VTTFLTSFCNKPHRLTDGKPVDHECYVLPPLALKQELSGDAEGASIVIGCSQPLRVSKGVRKHNRRDQRTGRYEQGLRCDGCGKPCPEDDMATDNEVCGSTDGPGFCLCSRQRCSDRLKGKSVEERRAIYTATRERLRAKGEGIW
jgi:hypothetical protein